MKRNIIYFSTALSDKIYKNIVADCRKFKPTYSGVGFDWNVGVGLSEYATIFGVSLAPIPSWPKYRHIGCKAEKYSTGSFEGIVPSLLAIPVVKELCFYFSVKKHVNMNLVKGSNTVVVISGLYRSLLRAARYFKKRYGLKVFAIVPDLPELMMTYRKDYSPIRKLLNRIDAHNSVKYRSCIDGFVFLSRYMNEIVNTEEKAFAVVDGLCGIASFPENKVWS